MSGGLIALIAVGITVMYLAAGFRLALRNLPRAWAIARREWSLEQSVRSSVKTQTACMAIGWPVYMTGLLVSRHLDATVDAGDPAALRQKIKQRDVRIRELERELGMPPSG